MTGTDPSRDPLLYGHPPLGSGEAPDGGWELRAAIEDHSLALYVELRHPNGRTAGGGGVSGVGLANEQRPVVITMSRRGLRSTFCYVGQAIEPVRSVQLDRTDGSIIRATLLSSNLPVKLWIAFTDRTAVPVTLRAHTDSAKLTTEIAEPSPGEGNALWGPIDDDDAPPQ